MTRRAKQVRISDIVIPKFLTLFNDRHKHIIITSGRAGTKSSYAAIRADYQLISSEPGSVVVLRKHHNKLRKTVYKEMIRGINRLGLVKSRFRIGKSPMEIEYRKTGNAMFFAGSDGIDDTKGIIDEDKPIKLVILDELTEFFDDGEGEDELSNIEATFVRGNSGGFQMLYLYNPPKNPNAPINEWCRKMEKRSDCIHVHVTYKDVPQEWLGQDLIESAEAMKAADEKMYRWIWGGESIGVDELIYYMFGNHNIAAPDRNRVYRTIIAGGDYGQQNATTFQFYGVDDYRKQFTGLKEYYHSGRETGKQKSPSEYAKDFIGQLDALARKWKAGVFYLYLDPSARGLKEEIRRAYAEHDCTYDLLLKDAKNDVALGISRVQKCLAFDIMTVNPAQEQCIREYGLYEYDRKSIERGKEEPVKINDHCMDATRYAVMGAWNWLKGWLPEEPHEEKIDLHEIGNLDMNGDDDEYF